jgi:hypothetical protein
MRGAIPPFPQYAWQDFFFHRVHTSYGPPPPASYPMGTGALSPAVKRSEHEAGHSFYPVPRLRMHGGTPPLHQCFRGVVLNQAFVAWHLVKHKDNFTFITNIRN